MQTVSEAHIKQTFVLGSVKYGVLIAGRQVYWELYSLLDLSHKLEICCLYLFALKKKQDNFWQFSLKTEAVAMRITLSCKNKSVSCHLLQCVLIFIILFVSLSLWQFHCRSRTRLVIHPFCLLLSNFPYQSVAGGPLFLSKRHWIIILGQRRSKPSHDHVCLWKMLGNGLLFPIHPFS